MSSLLFGDREGEYLRIGVAVRGYSIMVMVGRSYRRRVNLAVGAMWG